LAGAAPNAFTLDVTYHLTIQPPRASDDDDDLSFCCFMALTPLGRARILAELIMAFHRRAEELDAAALIGGQ
jgi:hypothetical protein